jgi:predicted phosphodiesterase
MIFGVISDSHSDRANALPHIISELKKRGAEVVVHCGDIELQHVSSDLFDGLKVVCALNEEQLSKFPIDNPPAGWIFTRPNSRILDINGIRCYVGHRFSINILVQNETDFRRRIDILRRDYDGLRWIFSGHTHHQILFQTQLVNFVNPGAVEDSINGYEFAVVDTETDQVVFCRIPRTKPVETSFSVGIISDTLNISKLDIGFWDRLKEEFKRRDVGHIIHCGSIALDDIGRKELSDFTVYYMLRPDQRIRSFMVPNWHLVPDDRPIVEINGRQFFIHNGLARILLEESEVEMHKECLKTLEYYPEVTFILYGGTNEAFLDEGPRVTIINPGDAVSNRKFAVICLPRAEITTGQVPVDPLPEIE